MARTQALSAYTFVKLYTFSKFSTYHTNAHTPIPTPTLEYIWALGTEQKVGGDSSVVRAPDS